MGYTHRAAGASLLWVQGAGQAPATPRTYPLFPGAIRILVDDGLQAFHEYLAGILQVGRDRRLNSEDP